MVDQRSSNTTAPDVGINEQGVQFHVSVRPWQQRSESNDCAVSFRDEHRTCSDLIYRHFDRVGVCEQRVTIPRIGKRCTQLQGLKLFLLREGRAANEEATHSSGVYSHRSVNDSDVDHMVRARQGGFLCLPACDKE
jgi:hypothetical protein